jgi:hypothetical protein
MAFIPVDQEEFNANIQTVTKVEPATRQPDRDKPPEQKVDRDSGLLVWAITVAYEAPQDFGPEFMVVQVPSQAEPEVSPGRIQFGGLELRSWEMGSRRGLSFRAGSFTQEARPSSKRTAPPVPPAPSGGKKAA